MEDSQTSEKKLSLKNTIHRRIIPSLRRAESVDNGSPNDIKNKDIKTISELVALAASGTLLSRVTIDARHMWIAKRIAYCFPNVTVNQVEAAISSPLLLAKINEFLGANAPRIMFCLYDSAVAQPLQIGFQPCEIRAGKFFYIIRIDDLQGPLEVGFENKVLVGECNAGIIKSLSLMLQNVYGPLMNAESKWGQSSGDDREAFNSSFARFMMTLTDIVYTIDSQVQLKKVETALLEEAESATANHTFSSSLMQQLEAILHEWQKAAKTLLSDEDPTLFSLQDVRPDAPLQYWRQRLANLNALNEQFEASQTSRVLQVLTLAKSDRTKMWQDLEANLKEATIEANENVKHLAALDKQFEVLYDGLPSKIAEDIGAIFLKMKRVRVMSKYLQNTDHMNGLLVKITNQIIQRCKEYILDGGNVWRQDPASLVSKMKECFSMNRHCQVQYRVTKHERVGAVRDLPFSFDESRIFAKFELFAARLENLIDLFQAFGFFKTLASQDTFDLNHICNRYFREAEIFKQRTYDLLDFTDTSFDFDYRHMCVVASDLERDLQKVIDDGFQLIESTDQALDLLADFQKLMPRDSLQPYLNAKHVDIFSSFTQEMDAVSNMYETQKEDPPILRNAPPVAGRILWVRQLLRLIEAPMQKFRENGALMISNEAKAIIKKYNRIASTLVDFEVLWERAWCSAAESAKSSLNATLFIRHPDNGKIYVNFDKAIVQMLRECHYMQKLQIEMPVAAQSLMEREIQLKNHAGALEFILTCLESASQIVLPDLQPLLSHLLSEMDHLLQPGMSLLTWTSLNVDIYIAELSDFLRRFQEVAAKVRDIYENRVQRNLRIISRTLLISLPFELVCVDDFAGQQVRVIRDRVFKVNAKSTEIETAVKDCISVVTHASISGTRLSATAMDTFYSSIWELLFHAVLACVRRSINALKDKIRPTFGSGIFTVDRPIFKINVEIVLQAVKTNPTLEDVQDAVNRCALNALRSIKIKRWTSRLLNDVAKGQEIDERIRASKDIVRVVLLLTGSIGRTTLTVNEYLDSLNRFSFLWKLDAQVIDENDLMAHNLDAFVERLSFLDTVNRQIDDLPSVISFGPICLSHDSFKHYLHASVQRLSIELCEQHCRQAKADATTCLNWMHEMSTKLKGGVRDLDDVRNVRSAIQEIISETFEMEEQFERIDSRYRAAKEFGYSIPSEELAMLSAMRSNWTELQSATEKVSDKLRWAQEGFKSDLLKAVAIFEKEVKTLFAEFHREGPNDPIVAPAVAMERLRSFQTKYQEKLPKVSALHEGEELFGLPKSKYPELEQMKTSLMALAQFYALYDATFLAISRYLEMTPSQLSDKLTFIEQEVHDLQRKIIQVPKHFWKFAGFKEMKEKVENFILVCPLLTLVSRRSMRPRHWEELMMLTSSALDYTSHTFVVKHLVALDLLKHSDNIEAICTTAQKELECEETLEAINKRWQHAAFAFKNFKNLGPVLLDINECHILIESIEESHVTLSVLMESKFSVHFHESILELKGKLAVLSDLIDMWLDVQRIFCNVQVVFDAEDISKQLPQETSRFNNVSKTFVMLIQEAYTMRYAMVLVDQEEHFRSKLRELRDQLETSQKFLAVHLNAKREKFPRLFLVPDALLLEALSLGSDFHSMRHLLACLFDSIYSLLSVPQNQNVISALQSAQGEIVDFVSVLEMEGSIEVMLTDVESAMKTSIKRSVQLAELHVSEAYAMENIETLVSNFPAQVCLLGLMFWWTSTCLQYFQQGVKDLNQIASKLISMQTKIHNLMNVNVPYKQRVKLEAFVEALIIQKDITNFLIQRQVKSSDLFDWQKQIKFGWDHDENVCEMKALHHTLKHSFEYVGCRRCETVPCITNKHFLFVIQSVATFALTSLGGSSGSGKSSTLRELGRKIGRYVVEFNCTSQSNQSGLGRILSGICQSGMWGCLDGLERVSGEVLSVVTVLFIQVFDARRAKKNTFVFGDGSSVPLNPASCCFTFSRLNNQDSSVSNSIPTNLKFLIRTLNFVVPSYEAFCRIKLCSAKFDHSDSLASKISCIYLSCRDIFDDKNYYDFSLRSLNYLLASLMALRSACKNERFDEFQICAKLLHSLHVCRLQPTDIPIFTSLLTELFGEEYGSADNTNGIETQMRKIIESSKLKSSPHLLRKVMHIYQASRVKHCLILVGPPCTGKSLGCSLLLQGLSKNEECPKKAVFINPLSMSSNLMFGWFENRSKEWTDGAFTSLWRKAMRNKMIHTWIVLDGPINTDWVDSLSTVFDDTKELSLANGDRVLMDECCRIVLEVGNLRNAPPSIIIRVAVVNFSDADAELQHVTDSWLLGRRAEEARQLSEFFHCFIEPIFQFISKECEPVLGLQPRLQMQSFLLLLSNLLSNSVLSNELLSSNILERNVIFALAWACMGLLSQEDRAKVDRKFAELSSNVPGIKANKSLLDHYLSDSESGQQLWTPIFPSGAVRDANAFTEQKHCLTNLFVPTTHTEALRRLNQFLQSTMCPLFVVGDPGTGKSTLVHNILLETISLHDVISTQMVLRRSDTAQRLQEMLCSRVRKRSGKVYGPAQGKKLLILLEDINLPQNDRWGEHPVSETLRFLLEYGSLYNVEKPEEQLDVVDTRLISTVQSLSNGICRLADRLRRHAFCVFLDNPDKEVLREIFEPLLLLRCKNVRTSSITNEIQTAVSYCLDATLDLFFTLKEKLLCLHNLHPVARAIQGVIQVRPEALFSPVAVISLWHHECEREFLDRLIGSEKALFAECMQSVCLNNFGVDISATPVNDQKWTKLSTSDLTDMKPRIGHYHAVVDQESIMNCALGLMSEYNSSHSNVSDKLNVTLFSEMLSHFLQVLRVICLERGNVLLISDAREGKSSIARLAVFAASSYLISRPKTDRNLVSNMVSDLKKLYLYGGLRGESATMLISHDDTVDDDVLDLISTAVSGVDADVFTLEEWGGLLMDHEFQAAVEHERKLSDSLTGCDPHSLFLHRIRRNVHFIILLSMSPTQFRTREKSYPGLTGHCVVSVWSAWSHDSLEAFAKRKLDLVADDLEAHRLHVANPNIEAELRKKIQDEEEEDVNAGTGMGRWNASDVAQAIVEAIAQEAKLREDLMSKVRETIPSQMARLHTSMVSHSKKFHDQFGASNHTSHCPFVKFCHYGEMFRTVYVERFEGIYSRHLKLKLAVEALESSEREVTALQSSASTYRTKAKEVSAACDDILEEIKVYTTEAEKAKAHYTSLETQKRHLEMSIDEVKGSVLKHFTHFDAIISELKSCLSVLSKATIIEISHLNPPPNLVTGVFDVILILLHRKLETISTILVRGRPCIKDSWTHSLEMIENFESFLATIRSINYYQITPEQMELMQPYLSNEDFVMERAKTVARGSCVPLVKWIRKIEDFYSGYEKVSRLMNYYRDTEYQYKQILSAVPIAMQAVKQNAERIDYVRKQYDEAVARRQLQETADESREMTLHRAQDLLKGLKAAKMRWAKELLSLEVDRQTLAGNSSMAAAFLTYCGVFDPSFRTIACEMLFPQSCVNSRVICSVPFSPVHFLSEDADLAQFRLQGLPSDEYFDQSALIVSRCKMWSLLIDPHEVTQSWITQKVKQKFDVEMRIINVYDETYLSALQECVKFGVPTLLQGVDEDVHDDIHDLFHIPLRGEDKPSYVRVDGIQIAYNEQFEMFMMATSAQLKYSESFSSGLMIVNFTSQYGILDLQLLAAILKSEQPVIEAERTSLQLSEAEFVIQIQQKRMSLLELVCLLDGKVLDKPEVVVQIDGIKTDLQRMAKLREDNHRRLTRSKSIIDQYALLAKRTRKVISCIFRLIPLNGLYIFNMNRYRKFIVQTIEETPSSNDVKERVSMLIPTVTCKLYDYISQSLLPHHKVLWTLVLAVHLDKEHGDTCDEQIELIAQPMTSVDDAPKAVLELDGLSPGLKSGLSNFEHQFQRFDKKGTDGKEFADLIALRLKEWESWYQSEEPEISIEELDTTDFSLSPFERLVLIRLVRNDRFYPAVLEYARAVLGQNVGDYCCDSLSAGVPVVFDAQSSFRSTNSHTPIIVVTTDEVNVLDIIRSTASEKGIDCRSCPLGHNQRSSAQKLLVSGLLLGNWVVFEGGQLDIAYISTLPAFWKKIGYVQDHFRLFITTEDTVKLPRNMLRMSILRCVAQPRTLRSSLYHTFEVMDHKFLSSVQDSAWVALVYSFAFLFSLARGRLQYGDIGWNVLYRFQQWELNNCLKLLENQVIGLASKNANSKFALPWDALQHIVMGLGLGAYIADPQDEALLETYVQRLFTPRILASEFEFVPSHYVPPSANQSVILRHIVDLPATDQASVYGLTSVADREKTRGVSESLLKTVAEIKCRGRDGEDSAEFPKSFEELQLSQQIESIHADWASQESWLKQHLSDAVRLDAYDQEPRRLRHAAKARKIFLLNELVRMEMVLDSLKAILAKCKHQTVCRFDFSKEDVLDFDKLRLGQVPPTLEKRSWSSNNLANWLLRMRNCCNQLREWSLRGSLPSYCLGGFFNPASFIRFFKLGASCSQGWPLESVEHSLEYVAAEIKDDSAAQIIGLFIYGASWDSRASKLVSTVTRHPLLPGPVLHLLAKQKETSERNRETLSFKAPCFKGTKRCSGNYVIDALFPSDEPPQKLILRSCTIFLDKDAFPD